MIAEILANAVGGILSEVLGTVLKQPVKRMFDEYDLQRALTAAVKRAEDRFARDYHLYEDSTLQRFTEGEREPLLSIFLNPMMGI